MEIPDKPHLQAETFESILGRPKQNLGGEAVCSRGSLFALLPLILGSASLCGAANTKYYINLNVGAGNVSGFIITDGTIGSLGLANFLDWNLLLNDGQKTFTLLGPLSGSNSGAEVSTNAMTATATELLFNFSGAAGADFFQYPTPGSGQSDLCFATEGGICVGLTSAGEKVFITGDPPQLNQPLSGTLVIATTTPPLPVPALSPVALAALGFLLTGTSLWRIRGTYRARHLVRRAS